MRGPWDRPRIKAETAEEIEQVQTLAGLRKRIFEFSRHDPLVRRVMDVAMLNGLNTEEMFARLAYGALIAKDAAEDQLLEHAQISAASPLVVGAHALSPSVKSDVKLIDELLLVVMRDHKLQPADLEGERGLHLTEAAMRRLRQAYKDGHVMTATWADYFKETEPKEASSGQNRE